MNRTLASLKNCWNHVNINMATQKYLKTQYIFHFWGPPNQYPLRKPYFQHCTHLLREGYLHVAIWPIYGHIWAIWPHANSLHGASGYNVENMVFVRGTGLGGPRNEKYIVFLNIFVLPCWYLHGFSNFSERQEFDSFSFSMVSDLLLKTWFAKTTSFSTVWAHPVCQNYRKYKQIQKVIFAKHCVFQWLGGKGCHETKEIIVFWKSAIFKTHSFSVVWAPPRRPNLWK